ncbi:nitrile hydratase accessory protein [Geodermatophilus ruber]|uniref:Nitrile hydratase accessory protein n=1 Tax=Geodermatophilus ruber TaxID=504800 RepID=A0A1I4F856_9ACTN|nr:nitrile hydratase accessory protein [Geodermatophilus ruber]SFL13709.1 nitrile hydratase accessory protein [Geodermatophilus ruber]
MTTPTLDLDIEGPAAPPRSNGELVFAEPWEGRAFGLTMALVHGGTISYGAFRAALIERIAAWEADPPPGEEFRYYRCWLQALEQVTAGAGLVSARDVEERSAAFAHRPAGHDHRHDSAG